MKLFTRDITKNQAKDTGMAMVLILLILGFLLSKTILFKIAIPVLIINMVIPQIYKPLAIIWLGLSHLLGIVVSRILLTVIFFLVVTPIGLLRRLLGIDSLRLREFKRGDESVMKTRNIKITSKEVEQPF